MINTFALFSLIITTLLILALFIFIDRTKKNQGQIKNAFFCILLCLLICCIGLILQITFSDLLDIPPIYFDYFVYIGTCLLPIAFLFLGVTFSRTKITIKKFHIVFFIIPIISLLILWTNDFHHLFYKEYSTDLNATVAGPYLIVHTIYSYTLIVIGIISLLKYSIKNSGFFSKQSMLICLGAIIPVTVNVLGTFGIINMSIYVTPISFALALLFFTIAIFKFNFLKIAPIALQRIVDRMSDAYFVLNENLVVTDFNKTLLDIFKLDASSIRNLNIVDLIKKYKDLNIDLSVLLSAINSTKLNNSTETFEKHFVSIKKYFHIEINSITNKGNFLGTLVLLKDVTQHNLDMQTIKENQDMLIEKERLASLGQMIGGIAHNLKTPIMSIAGATEGLSDLIKEYDISIGDPSVTSSDHHEIVADMNAWTDKIKTHLSYMSDIITAVKGQAVAFSDNTFNGFTVGELVKHVDILMRHELKNALINLKTDIKINPNTEVKGNINSLVQVINNIISNAIQAYNGATNKDILFELYQENEKLIIKIEDFAGGLPEKVQNKLFKEMITTKGKNGTGLGLFMSYSNIKAHFSGKLRYETEKGKGTKFYIEIPL